MAMIKCSECGKDISNKSAVCIHCGCPKDAYYRQDDDDSINELEDITVREDDTVASAYTIASNRKKVSTGKIVYILFIACFAFFVIFALIKDKMLAENINSPVKSSLSSNEKTELITMAQLFVKDNLKSPSSADFPWSSSDYSFTKDDDCYYISSWVDSQNGFGAMIRSDFKVTIIGEFDGKWSLVNIVIE